MNDMCVYCGKSNDFNGEHMFSAGLGGDDKNYMLNDCVCKKCNDAFSVLENDLMRKSVVGLARSMMQDTGRDRGSKTNSPKMQLGSTHLWVNGVPLEALNLAKLKQKILPQIVICSDKVFGTADNDEEWNIFFEKLERFFLLEEILVVEKEKVESSFQFKVTVLRMHEGDLLFGRTVVQDKAPKEAIWINLQESTGLTPEQLVTFPPRFYLHGGKSINYKSTDSITFLSDVKNAINYFKTIGLNPDYKDSTIMQSLVSAELSIDIRVGDRALVKNGLNLLIKAMGADYVRHESFSSVKSSILNGCPELPFGMLDENDPMQVFLGEVPKDYHVMFLAELPASADRSMIVFVIKLYGQFAFKFFLATDAPAPKWKQPIYCLVNYQRHEIKPVDALEYTRKYCPEVKQLPPSSSAQELGQK